MADPVLRQKPALPATEWLSPSPPATRFTLHGDSAVRARMSEVSHTVAGMGPKTGFTSAPVDGASHPLPRVMGRLVLLKLLARGGMGDVYLAATTGLEGAERACVVKTVRRDHVHDGSFLARFLDEARVQAQLNHPGVAQVLEAATDDNGEPFTVVEYVEGRSLADVRQRAVQMGTRIGWPEPAARANGNAAEVRHAVRNILNARVDRFDEVAPRFPPQLQCRGGFGRERDAAQPGCFRAGSGAALPAGGGAGEGADGKCLT